MRCPPTSEKSLEIESNFNTRQMIILKQNTAYELLYFLFEKFYPKWFKKKDCHTNLLCKHVLRKK